MARPTNAESARLTEHIVEIATRSFLRDGYANASMEQIAMAAGTSKRSLYARFASKSDLFREVVLNYSGATLGQLRNRADDDRPMVAQLSDACRRILEIVLMPDVVAMERIVISEAVNFPELALAIDAAREQGIAYLGFTISGASLAPKDGRSSRNAASQLWDLVIAPAVRSAVLGLAPCKVTDESMRTVDEGVQALWSKGLPAERRAPYARRQATGHAVGR
ncbi:MAG: TetR/AcrR family transcriptional regulator [Pseudomonadota bacterium]|jgi:TetR/AcrR family transcriptional repressor of mexJK operon|uniref:TetR/AcrR family transcriptional regulator n=1 Tax=Sphingomonas sp. 67-41 TaxID=1895850 RepID=UPI000961775D|nr:TetR/AcrR family transcriptional regulator [Sphingomonas sp. 67-41]OJY51753.1 MAG: hypothetical protein BGP17_16150 [Sphingomonas sp. 67-41]|tara:strand:- start:6445 stop:7110 length:666 start_codon:yes stop_codon:yes gene_type:complete